MNKFIVAIVALVTFAAAAPVSAEYLPEGQEQRDVVPSRDMIVDYLAGEGFVLSRLELREYSPDPVEDLIEIANNTSHANEVRSRAIQSLGLYRQDARVSETLGEMVEKMSTRTPLFSVALHSYAHVHGEAAAETVAEYLDADDAQIRMTAVVSLGRFGGQTGFDILRERQDVEEDDQVRTRIESYVR